MSNQQVVSVGTKFYHFEVAHRMILYFMQRHVQYCGLVRYLAFTLNSFPIASDYDLL